MKAKFQAFISLFGINEVLFLAGLAGIFAGISGKWSVFDALTVCGAVLVTVSIIGIMYGQKKG